MHVVRKSLFVGALAGCLWAVTPQMLQAETIDEKIAATDMSNPDQLYDLALFMEENRRKRSKLKYLRAAIKIDPDHAPSREALGFVYYKNKWVHQARLPKGFQNQPEKDEGNKSKRRGIPQLVKATGPGPKSADIDWKLQKMSHKDLDSHHAVHLRKIIGGMQTAGNFTNTMDAGFRTLLLDEYWELGTVLQANGLMDGTYKDLYGPSMMVIEQRRRGDPERVAHVERLLNYIGEAAKTSTDQGDLQFYCMMAAQSNDKRHVPRLLELMASSDQTTQRQAKLAIANITMIEERTLTLEDAQKWWDRYHASPDGAIYGSMLTSNEENVQLAACRRLYNDSDRRILPVLARLAGSQQVPIARGAVQVITKITGNDWGLADYHAANREAKLEQFEKWVKNDSAKFTWIKDRQEGGTDLRDKASAPVDQTGKWLGMLTSLKASEVRMAEHNLKKSGKKAHAQLIAALEGKNILLAQKARDLLRTMSGKNFGYDPVRGSASDRKAAVEKWQSWAAEQ